MSRAFTLLQLLIVVVMLSLLMSASTFAFLTLLKTWGSQDTSLEIQEDARQGVERMLRDLRLARAILVSDDSIRYTVRESGTDVSYIFYLYHPSDPWGGAYTQSVYQLKRTTLSSTNLSTASFSYGTGTIYVREVRSPPTSDMSVSGTVVTIDLTVSKADETFHLLEKIRPRNL